MALLLNLASLRIATYTVISSDDTAEEAIDYVIEILGSPGSSRQALEAAKDLADDVNNGLPLEPSRIGSHERFRRPPGTAEVRTSEAASVLF